jgi:hypothetical protein
MILLLEILPQPGKINPGFSSVASLLLECSTVSAWGLFPHWLSALILPILDYGRDKKYAFSVTEAFTETRDRFMSGFFDINDEESERFPIPSYSQPLTLMKVETLHATSRQWCLCPNRSVYCYSIKVSWTLADWHILCITRTSLTSITLVVASLYNLRSCNNPVWSLDD